MTWKKLKFYLISAIFVVIGMWLYKASLSETDFPPILLKLVGLSSIVFFGGGALFYTYKSLRLKRKGQRQLEFTDEGIVIMGGQPIPWKNITGFKWQSYGDMILIFTKNPLQEINEEKNFLKRFTMRLSYKTTGALYAFSTSIMEGDKNQILEICERVLKKHTS
ncbi:STM3941 family protein [Prevotella sp. HUN102]|uniref:STM3941 family protein n=1 Tax=Prevotella sp. HUN102 TaxID=1392486 RepID=UPI00048E94A8|nr:STM3941 family protein [Prevotella sp. HUN102]